MIPAPGGAVTALEGPGPLGMTFAIRGPWSSGPL